MTDSASSRPMQGILLDIGDDVGALVIYTPPSLAGKEIEISRIDDQERRSHTEVLERQVDDGATFAAVFDALSEGTYVVWTDDPTLPRTATIRGGEVSELDWR